MHLNANIDVLVRLQCALYLMLACAMAGAQGPGPDPAAEINAAFKEAQKVAVDGPHDIPLVNQAMLALPKGYAWVPAAQSERVLRALGNTPGPSLIGMVFPTTKDANWMAVLRYIDAGYIKDDDAKTWDAEDLLKNLKEGTEEQNKERKARGISEMEVVGWVQPPTYDAGMHRLVWSASTRDKSPQPDGDQGVNYNTYMLGREGYVSLNLVTDLAMIESHKPAAQQLLASLNFVEGKRYADFNSSTDKVAEYGLAALVGGIAAKKLGLLATLGVLLAKFWKLGLVALVGVGAIFKGRKKTPEQPPQA